MDKNVLRAVQKMKAMENKLFQVFIGFLWSLSMLSAHSATDELMQLRASGCVPPSNSTEVSYNAVKMRLNTNGVLWYDRTLSRGAYVVGLSGTNQINPPGVLFAGSVWIGGKDSNGQLKLAAMLYGVRGNDFFPGPLSVTPSSGNYDPNIPHTNSQQVTRDYGEASVNASTCVAYDRFFSINKNQVREFIRWWDCNKNPGACPESVHINPQTLNIILNWPAHGDENLGQDKYLAPFYDKNKNGIYDPIVGGDYPWYDFDNEVDCTKDRRTTLKGEDTHWWVFNDKGNEHGESGGSQIGLEIRAQAFSFRAHDEINDATFYHYEIINRSSQTLFDTYFAKFADPNIGGSEDDYVGCDVSRGLAYAMNGFSYDGSWWDESGGYRPPAIAMDLLEGPYQDDDGKDNIGPFQDANGSWIIPTVAQARADKGTVYSGLGVGYGDGLVDNERLGMRHFMAMNRGGTGGPTFVDDLPLYPHEYYNYMTGFFKNGQRLRYGGFGVIGAPGTFENVIADYMFPGNSDPMGWGLYGGGAMEPWSEIGINNPPGDRRFVMSAGPFTMRPGSVNSLTLGVSYARGSNFIDSRDKAIHASSKAQALFDHCLRTIEPPHAPRLRIQALQNELILMIDNPSGNNVLETYAHEDKLLVIHQNPSEPPYDKTYRFEGYQIFQVRDPSVGVADLSNPNLARLTVQCDLQNGVGRIINHVWDSELGVLIPQLMVDGGDTGIRHSFSIKEDLFATGANKGLVNHKTYHFIAIAYAHNEFKPFIINSSGFDGQNLPYISSKLSWQETPIQAVSATPRDPLPGLNGTLVFADYGTQPEITRLDGRGNMGLGTDLHPKTINKILTTGIDISPTYSSNRAPIDVKVIDPLNILPSHYELYFNEFTDTPKGIDTARWIIKRYDRKDGELLEEITSEKAIGRLNSDGAFSPINHEQLIPEWGISVRIQQETYFSNPVLFPSVSNQLSTLIEASLSFKDSSKIWLTGVKDTDLPEPSNWILSGTDISVENSCYRNRSVDHEKRFDQILGGIVTHFRLIRNCGPASPIAFHANGLNPAVLQMGSIANAPSIDLVFTNDRSKWTRSTVLELCPDPALAQGNARAGRPRSHPSVDKNGRSAGQSGYNAEEGDAISSTGMGWFPGYAIDVETGRRLNIAFGENSLLGGQNGADMIWNPTSRLFDNVMNPLFGGQHVIYIIGEKVTGSNLNHWSNIVYDSCAWFHEFSSSENSDFLRDAWRSVTWVMYPMLVPHRSLLETDATIKIRIAKRFQNLLMTGRNVGKPAFEWNMDELATQINNKEALVSSLALINVVPNPYYAYSAYELHPQERVVKIVNLPQRCTINIYNLQGRLVRSFEKDNPTTSLDWDLLNFSGQSIAGGVYLIHVHVPHVGDRVLKWFGGLRI